MRKSFFPLTIIFFFIVSHPYSQNPEWINYTCGLEINTLAEENDTIWVGTIGGLVKIEKQSGKTTFYNKANSGLPHNFVSSIAIDSSGNKWICTFCEYSDNENAGVAKFDGINWEIFPQSNTLIPPMVWTITVDRTGKKWVGTLNGLAIYNDTVWTRYNTSNSELPDNQVFTIIEDKNGTIWIGTFRGLVEINNGTWTVYDTSNSDIPNDRVYSIYVDTANVKWIGTDNCYFSKFDGINWTNRTVNNSNITSITRAIAKDKVLDKFYIGTNNSLWSFTLQNEIWYSCSPAQGQPFRSVLIDNVNNKWVGSSGSGLFKGDGSQWTEINTSNSGLPNNFIYHLHIDKSENIWLEASDMGLVKVNDNWKNYNTINSDIPDNDITSMAIDSFNNIWIGTYEKGAAMFDGTNWIIYNHLNSPLPEDARFGAIAIDSENNKWFGCNYLYKFDNTNWSINDTSNSPLKDTWIQAITHDNHGITWIGTGNKGLFKFDGTNWTIFDSLNSDLPMNDIRKIEIDNAGNKWIGTWGRGLCKFSGLYWSTYNTTNSDIPGDYITFITEDDSGNIWIGARGAFENGLAKISGANWEVFTLENSGLPGNVSGICVDLMGNKWISTDRGLAVFKEDGIIPIINAKKTIPNDKYEIITFQNTKVVWISYTTPKQNQIIIKLFDTKGRIIKTLLNDIKKKGEYKIIFNTKSVSNGTYFINMQVGNKSITKKIVVLK